MTLEDLKRLYREYYVKVLEKDRLSNVDVSMDQEVQNQNIQKIKIFKNATIQDFDIEVIGDGVQQSIFSISKYPTLSDVINELIFSDDIYPFYATVEQTGKKDLFFQMAIFFNCNNFCFFWRHISKFIV